MAENILTSDTLARFVVGKEGGGLRVITILKIINDDNILFGEGLTPHKTMVRINKLTDSNIGFAGRVHGWLEHDARLSVGGMSLSGEYRPMSEEKMRAFELIKAMMAEIGGELTWDNSI